LNSSDELRELLDALRPGNDVSDALVKRDAVANLVSKRGEAEVLTDLISSVDEFLNQLRSGEHNLAGARGALNRIYGEAKKWDAVKKKGTGAFPTTQRHTIEQLIEELKSDGLFVVPVGSLEGWLEVGTIRKNKWIVLALETLAQGKCGERLKAFIKEILESMGEIVTIRIDEQPEAVAGSTEQGVIPIAQSSTETSRIAPVREDGVSAESASK